MVQLKINYLQMCISERNFTVFSLLNLDAPYMRQPTTNCEENEVRGCCCNRRVGVESAQLTVSDTGLLPGMLSVHKKI